MKPRLTTERLLGLEKMLRLFQRSHLSGRAALDEMEHVRTAAQWIGQMVKWAKEEGTIE